MSARWTESDRLLRLIVRERRCCERCGKAQHPSRMDVAHIVRRRFSATRCDERNVWLLCHEPCHRVVDNFTGEHDLLVFQTIGEDLHAELRALAEAGPSEPLSAFWKSETARLRERCSALGIPTRRSA